MELSVVMDTFWILIASFLVFSMHAGFAMVEAGFTRAKNTVNILMKNFMNVSVGLLLFFLVGYGLMFGKSVGGFIGADGFILNLIDPSNTQNFAFWFFQAVFAATAATIVSGAVAERMKFYGYLIYCAVLTAVIYPIVGHWIWGGGWLAELGMIDFAGSDVKPVLKNIIKNPQIEVGEFTYYDDPINVYNFEKNVLYLFDFVGDKLIIGKFCQIASNVKFIMNGANHSMHGFSTYIFL